MMLMLAVLALIAAEPPPADEVSDVDGLQQMYDQSCAAREYGAFDDLCDQLSQRLHEARVQAAREARRKPVKRPAATVQPAAAPPVAAPPATPASTAKPPGAHQG